MARSTDVDDLVDEVFHQPARGLGTLGCMSIFLGPAAVGVVIGAFQAGGRVGGYAALAVTFVAGVALYVFFNEDVTLTVGRDRVRLVHTPRLLGLRGRETVAWELPTSALTHAKEVVAHTPSRQGGWTRSVSLHLPKGIVLEPSLLGGEADGTTYRRLTAWLERRLGDRFERIDDFGPLNRLGSPPR